MSARRMQFYDIEKRLLISLITDTGFCHEILPILDKEYLSNDYSRQIHRWVASHFEEFGKAPGKAMLDIYHNKGAGIKEETRDVIGTVLEHLSSMETIPDTDHSIKLAKDYLSSKLIELTARTAQEHIDRGHLTDAQDMMSNYVGIKELDGGVENNWTDAELTASSLNKMFYPADAEDVLLTFPGKKGEFMGPLEKGWLVSYLAPMKRGKTFMLADDAMWAARMRINTLFVSLEMSDADMNRRAVSTLTGMANVPPGNRMIPIFDCLKNQVGGCGNPLRPKNNRAIEGIDGDNPEKIDYMGLYRKHPRHNVCTICRGTKDFQLTTWMSTDTFLNGDKTPEASTIGSILNRKKSIDPLISPFLRTKVFPTDSATLDTLSGHMNHLAKTENWVPQLLVLDYADLLKAKGHHNDLRHSLGEIWNGLKGLAQERDMLIITASQTNRGGMRKGHIDSDDAAEHIGKISISDLIIGINRTKEEKLRGICRLAFLDGRHGDQPQELLMTQILSHGQACMDCDIQMY